MVGFLCLKWPLGPQGFSTLNFESYSVWYSSGSQMGMFLTFSKNPRWYTEKKGNQDPKICILVLVICIIYIDCDICIFRLGVYDIGRFIVYLVIYYLYILCWEWGRWVVYLVSVYLVLFCLGGN